MASLKSKIDKLDIDKLKTTPVHLSKLSDVVKNEVVKKTIYDESVKRVNAIETTDTSNLVTKDDYNTKIAEIENKILHHDHGKDTTTQKFIKLKADNFPAE